MQFSEYLSSFSEVLSQSKASDSQSNNIDIDESFSQIVDALSNIKKKGIVYLVGNGGSSGIASHSTVDFINACGFKAHAITDNSLLTCMANDYGYENVFSQPLKTLITENDALISISSSGKSQNILNACDAAKDKGAFVLTFSGFKEDNPLRNRGDINLWLPSEHYGRVEIGHALLLHHLTDKLSLLK